MYVCGVCMYIIYGIYVCRVVMRCVYSMYVFVLCMVCMYVGMVSMYVRVYYMCVMLCARPHWALCMYAKLFMYARYVNMRVWSVCV